MTETLRVLVVEDSVDDAELLVRMLRRAGYDLVWERVDSAAALQRALAEAAWDIVIADYSLPGFNALGALEILKASQHDLPFIILSGNIGEATAVEAMRAGAHDYIMKDNMPRLLPAIDRELREAASRRARRRAEEALQRRAAQLAILSEVAISINNSLLAHDLLQIIAEAACRLTDAGLGVVCLLDTTGKQLGVPVIHQAACDPQLSGSTEETTFEQMSSVCRDILVGRAIRIDDLQDHPAFAGLPEGHPPLKGLLGMPLLGRQGEALGLILASWKRAGDFSQEDEEALVLLARQVSIALENTRLYQEAADASKDWTETFNTMAEAVCLLDLDYTILRANLAMARIAGCKPEDLIGRKCYEALHFDQQKPVNCPVCGYLANGKSEAAEITFEHLSAGNVFEVTAHPILDNNGKPRAFVHIARNVTDNRRLQTQLLHSQKLAAVGEFVSGIAHELNNPLAGIRALSELLLQSDLPAETKHDLVQIEQEAVHASRIVQNLLAFARRQEPVRNLVDANRVISEVLELRAYQLRNDNVEIVTELAADLPRVWADPHQLQQVLLNLINNAHQAMLARPGMRRLTIVSQAGTGRLSISVSDTGPGLPPDTIAHIFDPFFTTRQPGEGTGLGLSICYGIVKDHGSEIRAANLPAGGAQFVIELPLAETAAQPTPSEPLEAPPVAAVPAAELRILLVEDEVVIRTVLTRVLESLGHHVTAASDGEAGLEKLLQNEYDAIICDFKMPGMGGRGFHQRVRLLRPKLTQRFIFCTGDVMSPDTWHFVESVKAKLLVKPFSAEDVKSALAAVLARPTDQPATETP